MIINTENLFKANNIGPDAGIKMSFSRFQIFVEVSYKIYKKAIGKTGGVRKTILL